MPSALFFPAMNGEVCRAFDQEHPLQLVFPSERLKTKTKQSRLGRQDAL